MEYIIYIKNRIYFQQNIQEDDDASCASGKIKDIYNINQFEHDISTEGGSSGCPVILLNNNINLIRVIGIHKQGTNSGKIKINYGTFIGEILNKELNNDENNYIISEIYIKDKDVKKNIRIINSYKEYLRNEKNKLIKDLKYNNEETIEKCEIMVNNVKIPFSYFYKFKSKGTYKIKYRFQNNLKNTGYMFFGCSSLTNINLSNFNSQNVTDMTKMFYGCSSLKHINLFNFNTQKVTNMGGMFNGCSSLIDINLDNFNTRNVINMRRMFGECSSLTNIDLSNFNTNNVTDICGMFYGCSSLNRKNVIVNDIKILKELDN